MKIRLVFVACAVVSVPAFAAVEGGGGVTSVGVSPAPNNSISPSSPATPNLGSNLSNAPTGLQNNTGSVPSAVNPPMRPGDAFPGSREGSFAQNPSDLNTPAGSGAGMPNGGTFGAMPGTNNPPGTSFGPGNATAFPSGPSPGTTPANPNVGNMGRPQ